MIIDFEEELKVEIEIARISGKLKRPCNVIAVGTGNVVQRRGKAPLAGVRRLPMVGVQTTEDLQRDQEPMRGVSGSLMRKSSGDSAVAANVNCHCRKMSAVH